MSFTCFCRKISMKTPIETKRKAFWWRFKGERKGGPLWGLTGPYTEWECHLGRYSEWKGAKTSPTCFRRKFSTETPIETKRKAFRWGFKGERKGKAWQVAIASEDVISVAIASGREPRRVQLVFVVKSQRKLRLRQNEKRFEEESKENTKEDSFRPDRAL